MNSYITEQRESILKHLLCVDLIKFSIFMLLIYYIHTHFPSPPFPALTNIKWHKWKTDIYTCVFGSSFQTQKSWFGLDKLFSAFSACLGLTYFSLNLWVKSTYFKKLQFGAFDFYDQLFHWSLCAFMIIIIFMMIILITSLISHTTKFPFSLHLTFLTSFTQQHI